MDVGVYNFTVNQGATFDALITLYTDEDQTEPFDLTDCTGRCVVKDSIGGDVLLDMNTENGQMILGAASGTINLLVGSGVTADLDFCKGPYDLQIVQASSEARRWLQGYFYLNKQV